MAENISAQSSFFNAKGESGQTHAPSTEVFRKAAKREGMKRLLIFFSAEGEGRQTHTIGQTRF